MIDQPEEIIEIDEDGTVHSLGRMTDQPKPIDPEDYTRKLFREVRMLQELKVNQGSERGWKATVQLLNSTIARFECEAAAMRAMLKHLLSCAKDPASGMLMCPSCYESACSKHSDNCKLKACLDVTAGKELLEWAMQMAKLQLPVTNDAWMPPAMPAWLKELCSD